MGEYLTMKDAVCRKLGAVTFPQSIGHSALYGLCDSIAPLRPLRLDDAPTAKELKVA